MRQLTHNQSKVAALVMLGAVVILVVGAIALPAWLFNRRYDSALEEATIQLGRYSKIVGMREGLQKKAADVVALEQNRHFLKSATPALAAAELQEQAGILKASTWLGGDEAFLVYNVDVLSNIDLQLFRRYHIERGGLATLAVRERNTARYLAFDDAMQLSGWRNIKTGDEIASRNMQDCSLLAFSGIQLVEPAIFKLISETESFPLIPLYLRLAEEHRIMGYRDQSTLWMDLGKPSQILEAERYIV